MTLEIRKIDVLNEKEKKELTRAFVECFYDVLFKFIGTKEESEALFYHFVMYDTFIGAFEDGELVGFLSHVSKDRRALKLDLNYMKKSMGWLKASIMYPMISADLQGNKRLNEGVCYIEYIGTMPQARGKGVASQLIAYTMEHVYASGYELDVLDTNSNAHALYTRLGFQEVSRVKEKQGKKNGAKYRIRMQMK